MVARCRLEALDLELARACRSGSALRLLLGEGLEALCAANGHHELGFSSIEAYALERLEYSASWVRKSRGLARKVRVLPLVRDALRRGAVGWSTAQIIADVATPETERVWLSQVETLTVREIRALARECREYGRRTSSNDLSAGEPEPSRGSVFADRRRVLSVTLNREDLPWFECARLMLRRISGGNTAEELIEALIGEGSTAVFDSKPASVSLPAPDDQGVMDQRRWEAQLAHHREQAEILSERRIRGRTLPEESTPETVFQGGAQDIDAQLVRTARDLAKRDLTVGTLANALWKADGWRTLGYATEAQYARERLGIGLTALKRMRRLARQVESLPAIGEAVAAERLGYESARLIAGVTTSETVHQWIERAEARTVKCLREEVDAAAMMGRFSGEPALAPPSPSFMAALEALEGRILSGAFSTGSDLGFGATGRVAGDAFGRAASGRLSTARRSAGCVTLRFAIRDETYRYYRWLEKAYERCHTAPFGFFKFLCLAFIETWRPALAPQVAYGDVYVRDRFQCKSPVCSRRDVTPHHLRFRSAGGGDDMENLAGLCVWCHLEGIHGGRLKAMPPASAITWSIGREPHTVVTGRERVRLS